MSRKKPTLEATRRSSPKEFDPDAFVTDDVKTSKRQTVKEEKVQQTVYLTRALRKRVALYCVEQEKSISDVTEEALESLLKGK